MKEEKNESQPHYFLRMQKDYRLENQIKYEYDYSVIFYTDNSVNEDIMYACLNAINHAMSPSGELIIVSWKPIDFGLSKNILYEDHKNKRSYKNLFSQALIGISSAKGENVFFAEHDVLYPPMHFDNYNRFVRKNWINNSIFYNDNLFMLNKSGAMFIGKAPYLSQIGSRLSVISEAISRKKSDYIKQVPLDNTIQFIVEPLQSNGYNVTWWKSQYPCIDIRHGNNISGDRQIDKRMKEIPFWGSISKLQKMVGLK